MQTRESLKLRGLLCLLLLLAASVQLLHAGSIDLPGDHLGMPISRIETSGNERTQQRFILKWSGIETGQLLSQQLLEDAQQRLFDTGLFISIEFSSSLSDDENLLLQILVKEKRYSLLIPRLSRNGDGDVKIGLRLRMHNLQGADQTLELLLQEESESNGDDSEEFRIGYRWPLYNRPYELEWQLSVETENTEVQNFTNIIDTEYFSFRVTRDWHLLDLSLPLRLSAAYIFEQKELDRPFPVALDEIEAGRYNRIKIGMAYKDVHQQRARRIGSYYSLSWQRGFEWLGSDFESSEIEFEVRGYRPLNHLDNINYRLVLSLTDGGPFNGIAFDIGGSSDLRGLEDPDARGDARFFSNIEYVTGYQQYPGFRSSLFVDFGNVYADLQSTDLSNLRYTIGAGVRWNIESFVKTDLFIDYGYDVEQGFGKIYGGTSLNF